MDTISPHNVAPLRFQDSLISTNEIPNWNLPAIHSSHSKWKKNLQAFKDKCDMAWRTGEANSFTQTDGNNESNKENRPIGSYLKKTTSLKSTGNLFRKYILSRPQRTMGKTIEQEAYGFKRPPRCRLFAPIPGSNLCPLTPFQEQDLLSRCRSDLTSRTSSDKKSSKGQHKCQPPSKAQVVEERVFRKKRSSQKQTSQNGWDKQRCYLEAMCAKEVGMTNVEEAQGKARESFETAVVKRKRAQTLMDNADLATYLAVMALEIADSSNASASLLSD